MVSTRDNDDFNGFMEKKNWPQKKKKKKKFIAITEPLSNVSNTRLGLYAL